MSELLFLAHRMPYPPNKGDKIRSWNILQNLAERYPVHLGCFIDDPEDEPHRATLEKICKSCRFVSLDPRTAKIRSLTELVRGRPLTLGYFRDSGLAHWCVDLLRERPIDKIFVFSSSMAQYAAEPASRAIRRVVDFVDVDSDKWRQYAEANRGPMRWVYRRESRTLLEYERRISAGSDASLFVSDAEAALFRRLSPETAEKVFAVDNGVDLDFFDPDGLFDSPFSGDAPRLVFTGAMDYWANVDAVVWFVRHVFPAIRARRPDTEFYIVGSKPTADVVALGGTAGVFVTGRVEDIRPYVSHALLVVAPLRIARGIQNKVLEAMAMAKPVVGTPEALEGIDAEPEKEFYCESEPHRFAERVLSVINEPARQEIGLRARKCVEQRYGWQSTLLPLKTILEDGKLD
ncbi:MAG: sugar transferase (PEP-CTERM/EpsH1 system associated) [Alphaproteobacteria bacterium]|jgi:sugar transferase (PEP-CTERM/EpsH1 system associated)